MEEHFSSALLELADVLGKLKPTPWNKVHAIVNHSPTLLNEDGSVLESLDPEELASFSLSKEEKEKLARGLRYNYRYRAGALAISRYLTLGGGQHAARLIPRLFLVIDALRDIPNPKGSSESAATATADIDMACSVDGSSLSEGEFDALVRFGAQLVCNLVDFAAGESTQDDQEKVSAEQAEIQKWREVVGKKLLEQFEMASMLTKLVFAFSLFQGFASASCVPLFFTNADVANIMASMKTILEYEPPRIKTTRKHRKKSKVDGSDATDPRDALLSPRSKKNKSKKISKTLSQTPKVGRNFTAELKAPALGALAKLLQVPEIDAKVYTEAYQVALQNTNHSDPSQYVVQAIQVTIVTGTRLPSLISKLQVFLNSELLDEHLAFYNEPDIQRVLYGTLIDGIFNSVKSLPERYSNVIDTYRTFLLENIVLWKTKSHARKSYLLDESLQQKAIESLCVMVKLEMTTNGFASIRPVLSSFSNELYTLYSSYEGIDQMERNLKNTAKLDVVVCVIGRITCYLNNAEATELLLPNLINRIAIPLRTSDIEIIRQLVEIALLGTTDTYTQVAELLVNIYRNLVSNNEWADGPTASSPSVVVADALAQFASRLEKRRQRKDFLLRSLRLFQQLAGQVFHCTSETEAKLVLQSVALLLPVLAELCQRGTRDLREGQTAEQAITLFKTSWFYCVFHDFGEENAQLVQQISTRFPPLIPKGNAYADYDEMIVNYGNFIKQSGISEQLLGDHRKKLGIILGNQRAFNSHNDFAHIAYLSCVYNLETLRARTDSFGAMLPYLESYSLMNRGIAPLILKIADSCFGEHINYLHSISSAAQRERILVGQIKTLLVNFNHREDVVRQAADQYITKLLEAFPQLLWNNECLRTLLDMLDVISTVSKNNSDSEVLRLTIPHTDGQSIVLPEVRSLREQRAKATTQLAKHWLTTGYIHTPSEMSAVLQEYFGRFHRSNQAFLQHEGYSLGIQLGVHSRDEDVPGIGDPLRTVRCFTSSGSSFANSLSVKTHYSGEMQGMLYMLDLMGTIDPALVPTQKDIESLQLVQKLIGMLIGKLQGYVNTRRESGPTAIDTDAFAADLHRAGAVLLAHRGSINRSLLHMVCWVPLKVFTKASMESGVFVWTWLLAAGGEMGSIMMEELRAAWDWTVNERIGLFYPAERSASPLSIPPQKATSSKSSSKLGAVDDAGERFSQEQRADVQPHVVFIEFLAERLTVTRGTSDRQSHVLLDMILKGLTNPLELNCLPSSLGAQFRLVLLGFRVLSSGYLDGIAYKLLRERIYLAALSWFFHPPVWHNVADKKEVKNDVNVLVSVCKAVEEDTQNQARRKNEASHLSNSSSTIGAAATATLSRTFSFVTTMDIASSMFSDSNANNSPVTFEQDGYAPKRAQLLQLLLGHELDRIKIWHNPHNLANEAVIPPSDARFSASQAFGWITAQWNRCIKTAWQISPKLAMQLGVRFPYRKPLRILKGYVQAYANEACLADPTAVRYLASVEAVEEDEPQLKKLLYCGNVTPPQALELLRKEYKSHPYVTQYAIRVLRTFPPDTLIFYLPQLIQTLRYDTTNLVFEYLLEMGQRSQLLAHQVIWTANTYSDEVTTSGYPIAEKAALLKEQMIDSFDDVARENYLTEFQFFDQVINISNILLPFTKEERRPLLREELEKIKVQAGAAIYLPTNPNSTVYSINPKKAAPMQSHAHAPILVTFNVTNQRALDDTRFKAIHMEDDEEAEITPANKAGAKKKKRNNRKTMAFDKTIDEDILNSPNVMHEERAPVSELPPPSQVTTATSTSNESAETDLRASNRVKRSKSMEVISDSKGESEKKKSKKKKQKELERRQSFHKPSDIHGQACIFKTGDDVRQDMLALQIIDLFKRIFENVGLNLFLFPYRVVATSSSCGIIECVPHAKSRDELGKQVEGSLYEYFLQRYGHVNSVEFQNARSNFLRSMAAYSVVSYILQIKDRHNGNMMIDDFGHIIHIDFGFIFDIAPGGNMVTFEKAPFKLSTEMVDLLGGSKLDSAPFKEFMKYCTQAYLAAREHADSLVTLVALMLDTTLPCFNSESLNNLRARLSMGKTEKDAAKHMTYVLSQACGILSAGTTYVYDVFQAMQNDISY